MGPCHGYSGKKRRFKVLMGGGRWNVLSGRMDVKRRDLNGKEFRYVAYTIVRKSFHFTDDFSPEGRRVF